MAWVNQHAFDMTPLLSSVPHNERRAAHCANHKVKGTVLIKVAPCESATNHWSGQRAQ